jgi:hypothetical protein
VVNSVTPRPNGAGAIMAQSPLFDALPEEWDDLTANVSIGFPIVGIKSGKWHYRYQGEDNIILDNQGRFPTPAIQVVLLKAQKELSRTFYPGGYVEGVNNPPECWSSHGVRPDDTVLNPVNPVCATCPNAAWGSGATPAAPKAQACQQRRRTVLIPYSSDLTNEGGGGPCLLSVPPGSLTNFVGYGNMLRDNRIHYAGVVTELSFTQDPNIAYPKIEFNYVRPLTDEEAAIIIGMREHEAVDRILNTAMVPQETDAPDVQAQAGTAAPPPAAPPRAPAPPPMRTATTSAVKPPVQQAATAAPAPNPVAAAKAAAAKAPAQGIAPPQPAQRVGGFNVAPAPKAQAMAPTATANAPIANAVRTASAPPPTTRKVQTPPPSQVMTAAVEAANAGAVEEQMEPEPDQVEGQVPDEMTGMFENLMSAQT